MKAALGYDDSLDAFGVHGVAGILGTLATGWFAYGPLTGGVIVGGFPRLAVQAEAVVMTMVYRGAVSWVLLKLTGVPREEEREGLDIVLHGEQVF